MSLEPAPSPRAPATGLPARLCCTLQHRRPRPAGRLNKLCMGNSMNIENMTVAKRLGLGFGLVLLLLAGITTLGTIRLSGLHEKVLSISEGRVPQLLLANNWTFQLLETARHTRNMLIFDDPAKIASEVEAVMINKRQRVEYMKQLQQSTVQPQGKALLEDVIESRAIYTPLEDAYLALVQRGEMAGAKALLLGSMRPAQLDNIAKLQKYVVYQNEGVALVGKEAAEEYAGGRTMLVALGVAALLAGVAAAWMITRSLLKQLGGEPADAVEAANRIASGDLSAQGQLHSGDKDSLMYAMDAMRDNLARIVAQVRSGTDTIAGASAEIASGNLDLSSRTEQQAGTLEETASSMEELNSTVKQNADNARQANQLAILASDVAVKGGGVVLQVVETMHSINASSRKIVDIIAVIDGIAFQTNILALNAAVEAARAGEQGRGFAVVATEVRNLAQRSASAAKEIKGLIGDSVAQIDVGSKLVDQAGVTMDEIVTSVKRVTDIMGEIASASREQEAGIDQINNAITEMDSTTQQNAALVEQAAAAAQSLQDQARDLAQAVGVFRLDHAAAAVRPVVQLVSKRSGLVVVNNPRPARARKAANAAAPLREADWVEF